MPPAHIGRRPPVRPAPDPPGAPLAYSLVSPDNGKLLPSENFALQHVIKLQEEIVSLRADLEVETRTGSELSLRNAELEREVLMLHEQLAAVAQGNCVKLDSAVEAVTSTALEADLKRLRQSGQRMRRRLEDFEVSRQVADAALAKGRSEIESLRAERDAMRRDLKRAQRLYRDKKEELDVLAGKSKRPSRLANQQLTPKQLTSPREPSKRMVDQVESLKSELVAVKNRATNLERQVREANDRAKNLQGACHAEKSRVRNLEAAIQAQRKALNDLVAEFNDTRATENQRLICLRKEADTYRRLLVDRNLLPAPQDMLKLRLYDRTLPLSSHTSPSGGLRRRDCEVVQSPRRVLEAT